MKGVLLPGNREVQVVDRPTPTPGMGEILVRTRASAVCRSDMSLYYGAPIVGGDGAGKGMVVPGHEPAGDLVAVHLAIGCGQCAYCLSGERILCPSWRCLGFDIDGGDADFLVVPAVNCLKLPPGLSYEAGALTTDMIGTQYHAQRRLGISGASTVAIFGLGP